MTSPDGERERLTAFGGLAAPSLDALPSVAYGPEAILVVLVSKFHAHRDASVNR